MADVNVVKQSTQEKPALAQWPRFETPLFRGSLFSMSPFALMRQFAEDMDRFWIQPARSGVDGTAWIPAIEIKEKEGKLLVTAELPGLKAEDVKVHVDGDTLIVEGERKQEKEEKRDGYYHSERSYGKFYRSILLPEGARSDQTAAKFNNGVLEVTVPVPEVKKTTRQIPVQEPQKPKAA